MLAWPHGRATDGECDARLVSAPAAARGLTARNAGERSGKQPPAETTPRETRDMRQARRPHVRSEEPERRGRTTRHAKRQKQKQD
ncbi:Hypothetical predicted protein [Pelobates cultripes]|uniref:Uncharacterized protein n=1 Tax=Pelobates cultripes TaxID=61616 RepID=A0AAD1R477_PELCU|nr:Hypothetical predicted protein [Pelobates cultripes]